MATEPVATKQRVLIMTKQIVVSENLTGRRIPIATPDKFMMIEHVNGLHTEEAEDNCPGCADDVCELPKEFMSTNS